MGGHLFPQERERASDQSQQAQISH